MLRGVVNVVVDDGVGVSRKGVFGGGRILNNLHFEVLKESLQCKLQSASALRSFCNKVQL